MKKQFVSVAMAAFMTMAAFAPLTANADEWVKTDKGYTYEYDNDTTAKSGWLKVNCKTY